MSLLPKRVVIVSAAFAGCFAALVTLSACPRSAVQEEKDHVRHSATNARLAEEQVSFQNGAENLQGTIFWPADSTADHAAVVILAGSDRSKRGPLRTRLARHFSAHNIVALVYDSPTGTALLQSRHDRAVEALSAAAFLRTKPGITADSVGLMGGSEGADVAIIAAAKEPRISFVIAVSGAMGVSALERLRYSAEKTGYEHGLDSQDIIKAITFKEVAFVLLSGLDIVEWPLIELRTRQWNEPSWAALTDAAKIRLHETLTKQQKQSLLNLLRQAINQFKNEHWFATVDPDGSLQRAVNLEPHKFFALIQSGRYTQDWDNNLYRDATGIRCSVLAIWGEQDTFLPPSQSATRLKQFLAATSHSDYRIKIFQNASHYLTKSGPNAEFAAGYVNLMTDWLGKRFSASSREGR